MAGKTGGFRTGDGAKGARPFTYRDMLGAARIEDIALSPNGEFIAFTSKSWSRSLERAITRLFVVRSGGGEPVPISQAKSLSSPTWSPDSTTIAYASDRGGSKQIWTAPIFKGKPRQLTRFALGVDNLRWSPAGDKIAFSAEVFPDAEGLDGTAARDREGRRLPRARLFDRLFVRHWDQWYDGKRNHIFFIPVRRSVAGRRLWQVAGPPLDLMRGMNGDCPLRPMGNRDDYSWSSDGKHLAFASQVGSDEAWSTDVDVFVVSSNGGSPKCITSANKAATSRPSFSPDGRLVAYLSMSRPGFESDRRRISLYETVSGNTRVLTENWDRSPESLAWSKDSKFLLAEVPESGRRRIYRVDLRSGIPTALVEDHHNSHLEPGGDRIYFLRSSMVSPAEVCSVRLDGSDLKQLTRLNENKLRDVVMSAPEEFHFAGAGGDRVQGWVLKPARFESSKKYPVAFIIHGGPQGTIEDVFHYRWNLQVFTGAGFGVVALNFHGSVGFGQDFTDAVSRDWGGKPFEDLMMGLDHAIANYPWLDANRVAALGASFGGWMVNWINGHTNRFKCLVNHDGQFDNRSSYFTTDELWFPEWDLGGTPWSDPDNYDRFSPSRFVGNWQTPTLVIHGAKDFRLVDSEGIATFTALQRRGIPSQLLYFWDEGHWVLDPRNSALWHETILAWLKRWIS